jgi:hypothetical protein
MFFWEIPWRQDWVLPTFRKPLSGPSSKAGCGIWSVNDERRASVFIYTVLGFARDGRTNGGGRHQVLGGSGGKVRCGGGGIKEAWPRHLQHRCWLIDWADVDPGSLPITLPAPDWYRHECVSWRRSSRPHGGWPEGKACGVEFPGSHEKGQTCAWLCW